MIQTSLFTEEQPREWTEVPQSLYDTWPLRKQLAYCAARDEAFALKEPDMAEWYRQRAQMYRGML